MTKSRDVAATANDNSIPGSRLQDLSLDNTSIANDAGISASKLSFTPSTVSRTVQSKLQDQVSVKDFGAVGDGIADDSAAINAAITYVTSLYPPTGTFPPQRVPSIYLPEGTYLINSSIIVQPGIVIRGDGPNATTVKSPNGTAFDATSPGLVNPNTFFHEISHLSIIGGNTAASPVSGSWGSGIHAVGWIRGCVIEDVYINGFEYGIRMSQSWTIKLSNLYVNTSSVDSIYLLNCGQATIGHSRLDNCSQAGVRLEQCESFRIWHSSIQKSRLYGVYTDGPVGADTLIIDGCFFERNGESGTGLGTDIYSGYGSTTVLSSFFTQPLAGGTGPATQVYATGDLTIIGCLTRGGSQKTGCRCDGKLTAINNNFDSTNSIAGGNSDGSLWVNNTGAFGNPDPKVYVHGPLVFKNNSESLTNKFTKRVFTSLNTYSPGSTVTLRITLGARGGGGEMMPSFRMSVVASHPIYQSDRRIFDYQCTYQYAVPTVQLDSLFGNHTPTFDQSSITSTGGSFDVIFTMPTVSTATLVKSQVFVTLEGSGWASLEFL